MVPHTLSHVVPTIVEIRTRPGMAKDAFSKWKELPTRGMSKEVKKKIVKTVIWSVRCIYRLYIVPRHGCLERKI